MINPGVIAEITLQRDFLESEDDILSPFAESHEQEFMSFSRRYLPADVINPDRNLATAHFILNDHQTQIHRSDYTFLAFIGDVGALLGTLQLISSALLINVLQINILAENDLLSSVFRLRSSNFKTTKFRLTYLQWFLNEFVGKKIFCCHKCY